MYPATFTVVYHECFQQNSEEGSHFVLIRKCEDTTNRDSFSDKYGTEDNSSGKCRIEERLQQIILNSVIEIVANPVRVQVVYNRLLDSYSLDKKYIYE
jgi:hypothetical protein